MLNRWAIWLDDFARAYRFSACIAFARSFVALGGFICLAFTPMNFLAQPSGTNLDHACTGIATVSLWCIAPPVSFEVVRWATVAFLTLTAAGYRPRFTAIPLWWVLFSNQAALTTVEGGDQIASVLALLLIPVSMSDSRKWHWLAKCCDVSYREPRLRDVVLGLSLITLRLQVAFIYLNACLSKLAVPEWIDGTAIYYWLRDPLFGPARWLRPLTDALFVLGPAVALATWGVLVVEFFLGVSLLLPGTARRPLLLAGLGLHLAIAVCMGLWGFGAVMVGALILLLVPPTDLSSYTRAFMRRPRARMGSIRHVSISRAAECPE
ncbi:sporulation-delaying protein SdpB family protein [Frondihabitans sp. 4ASC-45]|uniref:sporulation-delaying protein SdpB family protein n=1 Tax=Frondihabitans sp. 4ASC-45 TaxID=3111636 RepID=UPI003C2C6D01